MAVDYSNYSNTIDGAAAMAVLNLIQRLDKHKIPWTTEQMMKVGRLVHEFLNNKNKP